MCAKSPTPNGLFLARWRALIRALGSRPGGAPGKSLQGRPKGIGRRSRPHPRSRIQPWRASGEISFPRRFLASANPHGYDHVSRLVNVSRLIRSMTQAGYRPWTVRVVLVPLSRMLEHAQRRGLIASNAVRLLGARRAACARTCRQAHPRLGRDRPPARPAASRRRPGRRRRSPTRTLLRPPARLQQPVGKVRPLAQLRDGQLDRADARVPVALPVAVSPVDPLGRALTAGRAAERVGSAPISASAKSGTIARSRSGLACSSCLRSRLESSIVVSTTVPPPRSSWIDVARMARWSAITGATRPSTPSRSLHRATASRRRNSGRGARTPRAGTLLLGA
jgi:hypothetical protein